MVIVTRKPRSCPFRLRLLSLLDLGSFPFTVRIGLSIPEVSDQFTELRVDVFENVSNGVPVFL